MGLDAGRDRLGCTTVESAIAIVDHRQMIEGVERPRPMSGPGLLHRGGADGPWPEAGARTVAGGGIERHTADHHIDAAQVTAIAAPRKTGNAGVGAFRGSAVKAIAGHGLVIVMGVFHGQAHGCHCSLLTAAKRSPHPIALAQVRQRHAAVAIQTLADLGGWVDVRVVAHGIVHQWRGSPVGIGKEQRVGQFGHGFRTQHEGDEGASSLRVRGVAGMTKLSCQTNVPSRGMR